MCKSLLKQQCLGYQDDTYLRLQPSLFPPPFLVYYSLCSWWHCLISPPLSLLPVCPVLCLMLLSITIPPASAGNALLVQLHWELAAKPFPDSPVSEQHQVCEQTACFWWGPPYNREGEGFSKCLITSDDLTGDDSSLLILWRGSCPCLGWR